MNISNFYQSSLFKEIRGISNEIHAKISSCINQFKSYPTAPISTPTLSIAIISDGGGYSVPKAIRTIEKTTGSKVTPINYHAPSDIDLYELAREVVSSLKQLKAENDLRPSSRKLSRVAAFIEQVKSEKLNAPISLKIIRNIQEIASKLDCIFLPGGEDVPPAWYESEPRAVQEDFYRSLVEFTLLNEAKTRGIPLMGVCRGLQVAYVFNGKKLEQNVPGHYCEIQTYRPLKDNQAGLLNHIFQEGVRGEVMHHQGIALSEGLKEGGELEPLTESGGLVKAAESKYGCASPLILTQFHPEFYEPGDEQLTKNNTDFFNIFYEGAKTRNLKRLSITPEALKEKRGQLRKREL